MLLVHLIHIHHKQSAPTWCGGAFFVFLGAFFNCYSLYFPPQKTYFLTFLHFFLNFEPKISVLIIKFVSLHHQTRKILVLENNKVIL